jgi:vacuolar-type H+-ATPase subunit H
MGSQEALLNPPDAPATDPAVDAIGRVLLAEQQARQAIAQAQTDAGHAVEQARAAARALSDRTERRIRRVVAAFERASAQRLAEIAAEAAAVAQPHVPDRGELAALEQAVRALASRLTGGRT